MQAGAGRSLIAAAQQADIRLACKFLQGTITESRCNNDFDKLFVYNGGGDLGLHQLIEGNDAAKTRNRVGGEGFQIGLGITASDRHAAGVGVFDNDTGRLLVKLVDTLQRSISIVDVVVGKLLALELLGSSDTPGCDTGLDIESRGLVRVFTVTEFLLALKLRRDVPGNILTCSLSPVLRLR